jgi:hypothetical protein
LVPTRGRRQTSVTPALYGLGDDYDYSDLPMACDEGAFEHCAMDSDLEEGTPEYQSCYSKWVVAHPNECPGVEPPPLEPPEYEDTQKTKPRNMAAVWLGIIAGAGVLAIAYASR